MKICGLYAALTSACIVVAIVVVRLMDAAAFYEATRSLREIEKSGAADLEETIARSEADSRAFAELNDARLRRIQSRIDLAQKLYDADVQAVGKDEADERNRRGDYLGITFGQQSNTSGTTTPKY